MYDVSYNLLAGLFTSPNRASAQQSRKNPYQPLQPNRHMQYQYSSALLQTPMVAHDPTKRTDQAQQPPSSLKAPSTSAMTRPKTAGSRLPPRQRQVQSSAVQFQDDIINQELALGSESQGQTASEAHKNGARHHQTNNFFKKSADSSTNLNYLHQTGAGLTVGSQLEQSASSPQFSLKTIPMSRRPVSAVKPRSMTPVNGPLNEQETTLAPLPSLAQKPTISSTKKVRNASAVSRTNDVRSMSNFSNMHGRAAAKSSVGSKSTKQTSKGKKKGAAKGKGSKIQFGQVNLAKKISRNKKGIFKQIDEIVAAPKRPSSAMVGGTPATQSQSMMQPHMTPEEAKKQEGILHGLNEGLKSDLEHEKKMQPIIGSYQVYNFYDRMNSHTYNSGSNAFQNSAGEASPANKPRFKNSASQPAILATNVPPTLPLPMDQAGPLEPSNTPKARPFLGQSQVLDLEQDQRVLDRKRQVLTRKIPSPAPPQVGQNAIRRQQVPPPGALELRKKQHSASGLHREEAGGHTVMEHNDNKSMRSYFVDPEDWTLLNRSYSVDTDDFMRHLQTKSQKYDAIQGNGTTANADSKGGSTSHKHLSKLERRMFVMEFMENARISNPMRALKYKGLLERHGRDKTDQRAKRELRRMRQQEAEWANLSGMAHSDDELQAYSRQRMQGRHSDFAYYDKIKLNDQYKKLQQLQASQPQNRINRHHDDASKSKSKSKSATRTVNSQSPPRANARTFNSRTNPLAQSQSSLRGIQKIHVKDGLVQVKKFGATDQSKRSQKPRLLAKKFIEANTEGKSQKRSKSRHRHLQALKLSVNKKGDESHDSGPSETASQSNNTPIKKQPREREKKRRPKKPMKEDHYRSSPEAEPLQVPVTEQGLKLRMSPSRIEEVSPSGREISLYQSSSYMGENGEETTLNDRIEAPPPKQQPTKAPEVQAKDTQQELMLKSIEDLKEQIQRLELQELKNRKEQLELRLLQQQPATIEPIKVEQPAQDPQPGPLPQPVPTQKTPEQTKQPVLSVEESPVRNSSARNDLQTIQSNHQREQMQSSGFNEPSSFQTDTELDRESKIKKQTADFPIQVAPLASSGQKSQESGLNESQYRQEQVRVTSYDGKNSPSSQKIEVLSSLQGSVIKEQASSRGGHKLFDIGEPSEDSGNLAAMLDLEINGGFISQHSSSLATSQKQNHSDKQNATKISSKEESHTSEPEKLAEIPSADKDLQANKQQTTETSIRLSSRPPLMKMRTSVGNRHKTRDLVRQSDERTHGASVGGLSLVHSEHHQVSTNYQKEESSALVTSNKQTIAAISVMQIPAVNAQESSGPVNAAPENHSLQQVPKQDSVKGEDFIKVIAEPSEAKVQEPESPHTDQVQVQLTGFEQAAADQVRQNLDQVRQASYGAEKDDADHIFQFSGDVSPDKVDDSANGNAAQEESKDNPKPVYLFSLPDNSGVSKDEAVSAKSGQAQETRSQRSMNEPILQAQETWPLKVTDESISASQSENCSRKIILDPVSDQSALVTGDNLEDKFSQIEKQMQNKKKQRGTLDHQPGIQLNKDFLLRPFMETGTQTSSRGQVKHVTLDLCQQERGTQIEFDATPSDMPMRVRSLQTVLSCDPQSPLAPSLRAKDLRRFSLADYGASSQQLAQLRQSSTNASQHFMIQPHLMQAPKVIVRSPFEQEILEQMTLAALQPKEAFPVPQEPVAFENYEGEGLEEDQQIASMPKENVNNFIPQRYQSQTLDLSNLLQSVDVPPSLEKQKNRSRSKPKIKRSVTSLDFDQTLSKSLGMNQMTKMTGLDLLDSIYKGKENSIIDEAAEHEDEADEELDLFLSYSRGTQLNSKLSVKTAQSKKQLRVENCSPDRNRNAPSEDSLISSARISTPRDESRLNANTRLRVLNFDYLIEDLVIEDPPFIDEPEAAQVILTGRQSQNSDGDVISERRATQRRRKIRDRRSSYAKSKAGTIDEVKLSHREDMRGVNRKHSARQRAFLSEKLQRINEDESPTSFKKANKEETKYGASGPSDTNDELFFGIQEKQDDQEDQKYRAMMFPKQKGRVGPQQKVSTSSMMLKAVSQFTHRNPTDKVTAVSRQPPSRLQRATSLALNKIKDGLSFQTALAEYEDQTQKILSKYVNKMMLGQKENERDKNASQHSDDLKLEGSDDESSSELSEHEQSYWATEFDDFGFENLIFSIVKAETINQLEAKLLGQFSWNFRFRDKALVKNITRMESQLMGGRGTIRGTPLRAQSRMLQVFNQVQSTARLPIFNQGPSDTASNSTFGNSSRILALKQSTSNRSSIRQDSHPGTISTSRQSQRLGAGLITSRIGKSISSQAGVISTGRNTIDIDKDCEIVNTLETDYPILLVKELDLLAQLNSSVSCLNISPELALNASKLESQAQELERTHSTSQYGLNVSRPSQKKQNQMKKNLSKWLNTTIFFSELKSRVLGSQKGSLNEEDRGWGTIDDNDFNDILQTIEEHLSRDDLEDFERVSTLKQQALLYLNIVYNTFIVSTGLFSHIPLRPLIGDPVPKPYPKTNFNQDYIKVLQTMIQEQAYVQYRERLWKVSQASKTKYALQGDRAQSFFDRSMYHNKSGLSRVVMASQARMAPFMRRSTIRQEINDTLFQRTTQLLQDPHYCKKEMRPFLVEKIRKTLEKTCTDENAYQYRLRLQELDSQFWQQNAISQRMNQAEKPEPVTQFSKMIIFINFHPQNEKKWVYDKYMHSLKRRDCDTPRLNDLAIRAQAELNQGKQTPNLFPFMSQKTLTMLRRDNFLSGGPMSHRGLFRGVTMSNNDLADQSLQSPGQSFSAPKKAFPFKLNDYFGYWTIVITDGCYQILVPARPKQTFNSGMKMLTAMSEDLGEQSPVQRARIKRGNSFSTLLSEPKPIDEQISGRISSQHVLKSGEASPITFYNMRDTSFGKQNSKQAAKGEPPIIKELMPQKGFNDFSAAHLSQVQSNNFAQPFGQRLFSPTPNKMDESEEQRNRDSMPILKNFMKDSQAFKQTDSRSGIGEGLISGHFEPSIVKSSSMAKISEETSSPNPVLLSNSHATFSRRAKTLLRHKNRPRQNSIEQSVDQFIQLENQRDHRKMSRKNKEGLLSLKLIQGLQSKASGEQSKAQQTSPSPRQKSSSDSSNSHSLFSYGLSDEDKLNENQTPNSNQEICANFSKNLSKQQEQHGKSVKNGMKRAQTKNLNQSDVSMNNSMDSPITPTMHSLQSKSKQRRNSVGKGEDIKHSFSFQQVVNQVISKKKAVEEPFTPPLKKQVVKQITRDGGIKNPEKVVVKKKNIQREIITSQEQLTDVRISSKQRLRLKEKGLRPTPANYSQLPVGAHGTSVSNTSLNMTSLGQSRSLSPSPQKNARKYRKDLITIVMPVSLQWQVDSHMHKFSPRQVITSHGNYRNPIMIQQQPEKKPTTSLGAILKVAQQAKRAGLLGNDGSNPEDKPFTKSGLAKLIGEKFNNSVNQIKQKGPEQRQFFKYECNKSKTSKNLLKLKEPEARILEKKEYESRVEQQERNKVFLAIEFKQIQVVEAYLKSHMRGVDVTDQYGNTLLSIAAQFGSFEICKLLIKEGANLNAQNQLGNTPLHYAIAYKMEAIGDLLIDSGAKETVKNKNRLTPWQGI